MQIRTNKFGKTNGKQIMATIIFVIMGGKSTCCWPSQGQKNKSETNSQIDCANFVNR